MYLNAKILMTLLAFMISFQCLSYERVRIKFDANKILSPLTPIEVEIIGQLPREGYAISTLRVDQTPSQVRSCFSGRSDCSCSGQNFVLVEYLNSISWYALPDSESTVFARIRSCGNISGPIGLRGEVIYDTSFDRLLECYQSPQSSSCTREASASSSINYRQSFAINPGISGAWYDPAQSGHGLFVEYLDANRMLYYWFTFDGSGRQAWFGGVGNVSGNQANANFLQTTGGRFFPFFNSVDVVNVPWGAATLSFSDCDSGVLIYSSSRAGYGSGQMNLKRLTRVEGSSCQ